MSKYMNESIFCAFSLMLSISISMERIVEKSFYNQKKYDRVKSSLLMYKQRDELEEYIRKKRGWSGLNPEEMEAIVWRMRQLKKNVLSYSSIAEVSPTTMRQWTPALIAHFLVSINPQTLTAEQWETLKEIAEPHFSSQ